MVIHVHTPHAQAREQGASPLGHRAPARGVAVWRGTTILHLGEKGVRRGKAGAGEGLVFAWPETRGRPPASPTSPPEAADHK
eukprot:scaffold6820_cov109-Isochrysis_galbana.AAC.3